MKKDIVELIDIIALTTLAGIAMPIGGVIARFERFQSRWLEEEFRHTVIAFGGGVLFSAVALVLVPQGIQHLSPLTAAVAMSLGGVALLLLDRFLSAHKTPASQMAAMLSDFIPEAIALGAAFSTDRSLGLLLALLIGLQNVPEGFNAYRELASGSNISKTKILLGFLLLAALGPIAGVTGFLFLSSHEVILNFIMLFAAGGILYLTFQDIAPQAKLERHWLPPLGAVVGFVFGLIGQMLIQG